MKNPWDWLMLSSHLGWSMVGYQLDDEPFFNIENGCLTISIHSKMVLWRSRYIYIYENQLLVFFMFFSGDCLTDGDPMRFITIKRTTTWEYRFFGTNSRISIMAEIAKIHPHHGRNGPNFHHGRNRQNPSASWPKWSKGCTFCWNIPLKAAAAFSTKLSHEVPVNGEGDLEGWGED